MPNTLRNRLLGEEREYRWRSCSRHQAIENALAEMEPPRVLLAEDDDDLRHLIANGLRADGFEVVEVSNGNELLDLLGTLLLFSDKEGGVDIVVSDVRMPGKSGLEILGGLRRSEWSLPVILITAFGDDELHAEALRLGAAAVLDKPFDICELRKLTRAVLT